VLISALFQKPCEFWTSIGARSYAGELRHANMHRHSSAALRIRSFSIMIIRFPRTWETAVVSVIVSPSHLLHVLMQEQSPGRRAGHVPHYSRKIGRRCLNAVRRKAPVRRHYFGSSARQCARPVPSRVEKRASHIWRAKTSRSVVASESAGGQLGKSLVLASIHG
jgi:hypothetical protein